MKKTQALHRSVYKFQYYIYYKYNAPYNARQAMTTLESGWAWVYWHGLTIWGRHVVVDAPTLYVPVDNAMAIANDKGYKGDLSVSEVR